MKFIGLEAHNVLRLRAVRLTMGEKGSIVIGGANEQGKSSILQAIELALAGGEIPSEVIHKGEKKGKVVARFDEFTVEKRFTRGKKSYSLVVKNADGVPQKQPQTLLNTFLKHVSLDPIGFMKMSPNEQAKIVTQLMGVDLSPFAERRAKAAAARLDASREVKRLAGALESIHYAPNVPETEQSVGDLAAELQKRRDHNLEGADIERSLMDSLKVVKAYESDRQAIDREILRLQKQIEQMQQQRADAEQQMDLAKEKSATLRQQLAKFVPADESAVLAQMAEIDKTNAAVRENARRATLAKEFAAAESEHEKQQEAIEKIDAEEKAARSSAKSRLPIDGISIDESGVLYNGLPLRQAGTSAQLRISVAVAMALNEKSKTKLLLVDDGESLDESHRAELLEVAKEAGFQTILVMVAKQGEAEAIIEDGCVSNE